MLQRLQKYMAECGIASRRKCEILIKSGKVKVNDLIITELGFKINPDVDKVCYESKIIKPENNKLYIMLNKPIGYVSTVYDEKNRKTVIDLVNVKERVYPIGRLDYDTSGLMLLTNDGEVCNKIIHPKYKIDKKYIAEIRGIPTEDEIKKFQDGIDIDGYTTSPAIFKIIRLNNKNTIVKIIIHEGKNRQVRKMCSSINHPVLKLKRVAEGDVKLGNLKEASWRFLNSKEINYLKSL